jgi:hypothetical protein
MTGRAGRRSAATPPQSAFHPHLRLAASHAATADAAGVDPLHRQIGDVAGGAAEQALGAPFPGVEQAGAVDVAVRQQ